MNAVFYKHANSCRLWIRIVICGLGLLLAACAGGGAVEPDSADSQAQPASAARAVPTMPAARFVQPTTAITPQAAAIATQETSAGVDLSRGETIYTNRCASCHGTEGEGVADKGNALIGGTLSLEEFEDVVRTGKNGVLGTAHIFGPTAISPSGLETLYAYTQSLAE